MEDDDRMSDEDLRTLAMDIVDGRVFTSDQIEQSDFLSLTRMIFMPISLMDQEAIESLQERDVTMFYEFLGEAGERSINGYPMFMSMRTLRRPDHKKLGTLIKSYIAIKKQFEQGDCD